MISKDADKASEMETKNLPLALAMWMPLVTVTRAVLMG